MPSYRYRVVDVFTKTPLEGNPLAVFPEPADLDGETMQRIARELNLSETAFIVSATRPGCEVGVRIFTPVREMVFAGHPTIGTSWVLLDERMVASPRFVLDEKVGPVPIRVDEQALIWLTTPPLTFGATYDRGVCAHALGLDTGDLLEIAPQKVGTGNAHVFVAVRNRDAVDRAWLQSPIEGPTSVFVFTPEPAGAYSRMFAHHHGVIEDPATGSATGPLAAFMIRHRLASGADGTRLISEQGVKMGRRSILHILVEGVTIEVGGHVTPLVEATMRF